MRYPIVRQHSEEDCGAACLATIAKHYGRTFTLNHVREAVGTGQLGTSLLGLKRGAAALGFNARSGRVAPAILDQLQELPLPTILHWQGVHWVVLYGRRGRKYVVADPAMGLRHLTRQELLDGWGNCILLLLEPDPQRFWAQSSDPTPGLDRFLRPVWTHRCLLSQALLQNLVLGLLALGIPILIQILTDQVVVAKDTQLLTTVVIAVMVMNAVSSSLRLIQSNLVAHFAQRLQFGLALDFGRQVLRLPLSYYESHRSGEIVSRLQDIQDINQLIAQAVIGLPSQFFIAVLSLGVMVVYNGSLTVYALLLAIAMTASTVLLLPTLRQRTRQLLILESENQGILVETFKGALTLKTTMAAPHLWEEFQSRFSRLANLTLRTIHIAVINNTFSSWVSSSSTVILLWLGSKLVIDGELTIGALLAFNTMNGNFLMFLTEMIEFVSAMVQTQTAVQRLGEVIDVPSEHHGKDNRPVVTLQPDADIVCADLSFHYAGRVDLLKDCSITFPGGQVTAVIGQSGCGKSTLAKLIAGLYDLQAGNIRVGPYNLQDVALDSLRQQVILVPQEAHFWSRTIVENFRLGAPHLSFEEIVAACQVTGADQFISQLPDKYQTILGEFGANLSGGQRQRLAIARAIVTDPPILILDESTAGLDPMTEAQVLDHLLSNRAGKTTLLISHRPTVISRADWLIFLEQGQLKVAGSLEELRAQPGEHLYFMPPHHIHHSELGMPHTEQQSQLP